MRHGSPLFAGALLAGALGVSAISGVSPASAASMAQMGADSTMPSMSTSSPVALAGGVNDGATTTAIVPMGNLGDPANTFYQLLTSRGSSWVLATPPAVATNGGLVVSAPSNGAVGILPFYALKLSGISRLVDGAPSGASEVVTALAKGPSSLAVDPSSGLLAYVSASGQVWVQATPSARMKTVATLSSLKRASTLSSCGVQAITSVALEPGGALALGLRCSKSGTTAVAEQAGGGWMIASLPGEPSDAVVRLDPVGAGVLALVRTGGKSANVRAVQIDGTSVRASPVVSIMDFVLRATSVSASVGPVRSDIVTMAGTKHVEAFILTPAAHTNRVSPLLPLSTRAVVSTSSTDVAAGLTAFEVNRGIVSMAALSAGGSWKVEQVRKVTIPYGSSE